MKLEGVFSVLATPFHANGDLDLDGLKHIVDRFIECGVTGFTVLGVTSEVARLNEHERAQVLDTIAKQVNGRVMLVVGSTADGLRTCVDYTRQAKDAGATAVMISPPRMPKLNSAAVLAHFEGVARAVDIPIVVQDFPPISGFTMEPSLLVRIAKDIPAARTIKLEDPPTPLKTARIVEAAHGLEISIFGGLGGVFLLEELMAGGAGAMTGFAFPEVLVDIVSRFKKGDVDGAAGVFYKHVPLMRFEFQEGIGMAIRKDVLRRRGLIESAYTRPPGAKMDPGTTAALERLLSWTGVTLQ